MISMIMAFPKNAISQIEVFTSVNNNDTINRAVQDLFRELGKAGIDKYRLNVISSFQGKGVVLLKTSEATKINFPVPAKLRNYGPEGLYIKSGDNSVIMIGNTALALQQAVFFYLEHLGFRYLLPGEIWEVIPPLKNPYKKGEILTRPDYDNRTIANGHGYRNSKKIENDFLTWEKANRMGGSFPVRNGHSYDEIMMNNAAEFKEHPEYFAKQVAKGTLPPAPKFNVANKNLVEIVRKDVVKRMEDFKKWGMHTLMVSMEPSDGGNFCTTPECQAVGTPSDQAFYLANIGAREIRKKYPYSWVGMLAYNEHILPTKLKLEPNIFVMITNGFNRSKYNTEQLLSLWSKKAGKVGVYEYLNVYEGSMDLPGQMHISSTDYLAKSIKKFHKAGATSYVGESTMGWVSKAVGNYTLARLLWDVNTDVETIKKDFFTNAFGLVAPQMKKVMDSWEQYPHRVAADNDLADWLRLTNEAYNKAPTIAIKKRINHVKIYLHYIVLYRNLLRNSTLDNYLKTVSFAYRTFETAAFATLPAMVSLGNYTGYKGYGLYNKPDQPWAKESRPYTEQELEAFFQDDLQSIKKTEGIVSFERAKQFAQLSTVFRIPNKTYPQSTISGWGNTEYIIQIGDKTKDNYFDIISGYSASPPVERNVRINIFKVSDQDNESPLLSFAQKKKLIEERFTLGDLPPGFYRVRVEDENKAFIMKFSTAINFSLIIRSKEKLNTTTVGGYNVFYFYVPPGVKKFQVSKTITLKMESPTGRIINHETGAEMTFVADVLAGEQGIWKIYDQSGTLYIEGIPPYLGSHPSRMLIPGYLKK